MSVGTENASRYGANFKSLATGISPWIGVDAVIWFSAFILAIWLRYDFSLNELSTALGSTTAYLVLGGLVTFSLLAGWGAGLYRGRFVQGSMLESAVIAVVFSASSVLVFFGHVIATGPQGVPHSTALVAGPFAILSSLALRSIVRRKKLFGAGWTKDSERAILFGAGEGGIQLVRQLRRTEGARFNPVAILDDDPSKKNMLIDGVRVHGGRDVLEATTEKTRATTLLIAVPSLASDELIRIRDRAEEAGLHVMTLPPLETMMHGRVAINELREINVNDLLGRKSARLDQTQIASYLRGKRILVTGAGGSIGSELCRQLTRFRPAEIMMLDRDESGLHAVQLSIEAQAMLDGDDTILASIRDGASLKRIFSERKPEIVFHAAALKHMPLLEHYPLEALKTNVFGTLNVLRAARDCKAETFVNISTDKAANPTSVLGLSKRIAERLTAGFASANEQATFVSVRFGNVLGSRGSVLTVFERQIQEGGPVTVTDPEVSRFFMTIPEACQLVLQACAVGASGETLVLDMGEPVKIADVARTLIEQTGKDIEIVYTGLRAKEKLSEELFDSTEKARGGEKHPSLSEVTVPPLFADAIPEDREWDHDSAAAWMAKHAYAEAGSVTAKQPCRPA